MFNMTHATKIAGIDPGLDGAFALITPTGVRLRRMPTVPGVKNGKNVRFINPAGVWAILHEWQPDIVCIEDVWSSSQMGVVSAFTFGLGKGILLGAVAALGVTPVMANPSTWKTALKVTADKKTSRALAQRLFPLTKFGTADEAEAALLAVYGAITSGKMLTVNVTGLR